MVCSIISRPSTPPLHTSNQLLFLARIQKDAAAAMTKALWTANQGPSLRHTSTSSSPKVPHATSPPSPTSPLHPVGLSTGAQSLRSPSPIKGSPNPSPSPNLQAQPSIPRRAAETHPETQTTSTVQTITTTIPILAPKIAASQVQTTEQTPPTETSDTHPGPTTLVSAPRNPTSLLTLIIVLPLHQPSTHTPLTTAHTAPTKQS
ncbi:hypothetical protein BDV12DRAFT_105389 [Aspergillus spectabilis]